MFCDFRHKPFTKATPDSLSLSVCCLQPPTHQKDDIIQDSKTLKISFPRKMLYNEMIVKFGTKKKSGLENWLYHFTYYWYDFGIIISPF